MVYSGVYSGQASKGERDAAGTASLLAAAAIGLGVALLRDNRLEDDVVCWLVNSDHVDQASFVADFVFAATKASKPSFEKTTYLAVTTSYVLS